MESILFQNSMPVEVTEGVTDPQSLLQLIESTLDPLLSLQIEGLGLSHICIIKVKLF